MPFHFPTLLLTHSFIFSSVHPLFTFPHLPFYHKVPFPCLSPYPPFLLPLLNFLTSMCESNYFLIVYLSRRIAIIMRTAIIMIMMEVILIIMCVVLFINICFQLSPPNELISSPQSCGILQVYAMLDNLL